MKNQSKNTEVWIGVEHLEQDPIFLESIHREFSDAPALAHEAALESSTSRRDFLKYLGFSVGAATIAASCNIPVKKALPFVVSVAQLGTRLRVLSDVPEPARALQGALDAARVNARAHAASPSLEDVFVSATRGREVAA